MNSVCSMYGRYLEILFCLLWIVVPACIALSGSIRQQKSLHMFGHSIYNCSVMESSFCFSYFLMLSYISSGMDSQNVLWLWTHRMSSGIESYNIRMCLVYARRGTSYSMYTFMSRWLPKTLCHNVCGISSEPVTAVAVYSQHSVPALIWHLL